MLLDDRAAEIRADASAPARNAPLEGIARRLAAARRTAGDTGHPAPSRHEVALLCEGLFDTLVPGSYPAHGAGRGDAVQALDRLRERLRALLAGVAPFGALAWDGGAGPDALALELLGWLPQVHEALTEDMWAAYAADPAATGLLEIALSYPTVVAVAVHRLAHRLHLRGVPLLPRMMSEWAHSMTGVDIHPGARIGRRFFVDHGTGVVVGATAIVGDDVTLYHGVTLGTLSFARDAAGALVRGGKRHPTIGNGVTIYAHAMVLGGATTVGDNAVIGAATVVTCDVAPGAMVCRERQKPDARTTR
ncbi:serine O-acetyltransferase EpsC [Ramlibacter sp.]|uniref:serine O-acetyltransferase EpsC n=1 Tax=Ramlibacter sp. TaxID=1917967 RepID=UPI001848BB84|nr:serine O-acetyltransferase EpsC [Ramlibacter sp.]MBA2676032.1 serine acetyltransferase [Ramlibacter sp.]